MYEHVNLQALSCNSNLTFRSTVSPENKKCNSLRIGTDLLSMQQVVSSSILKKGGSMKLVVDGNVLEIQGQIEDPILVQILTESAKESSIEEAFLEIVLLGATVKEVIQTTATTQLLAKSSRDFRG
jgi:hypothetical protein